MKEIPFIDTDFMAGLAARLDMPTSAPAVLVVPKAVSAPGQSGASEYLRMAEAAKFACVSEPTLRSWGQRGLRILRPSRGVVLVKRSDLVSFIEGGGE